MGDTDGVVTRENTAPEVSCNPREDISYTGQIALLRADLAAANERYRQAADDADVHRTARLRMRDERDDALRDLAAAKATIRRLAISSVTANPGVLHHYKCASCGGRWSGRPTDAEQHAAGCDAAIAGGKR